MILQINNLSFDYSDTPVLENLSFSLEAGDFLGIIGSNGTGKSTLIKLILGLLPCRRGEITLLGQDRHTRKYIEGVGYVSQKAASFNSAFPATVREVVCANLYRGLFRRRLKTEEEALQTALEQVGMEGYENRLIGNLSGGQQQRIFIARALIAHPRILFLDEPTVGVDARSAAEITELICRLNREGMTIVMTNHDTHALVRVCNKLLILDEGQAGFVVKSELSADKLEKLIRGDD